MKYFPVKIEKFGNEYFAVKIENGFESEDYWEVYDWIEEKTLKDFDFDGKNLPEQYYVFPENGFGYALIKSADLGEDEVTFYDDEDIMKDTISDLYGEEVANVLLKEGYYYDDSEYTADEIDDGTWSLTVKKIELKKQ